MARYIVADLHGRYDLYQEIENFRQSGDTIICLGDCGDRGPQSYETIAAVADNPNWVYFLGNHEHMTLEALREVTTKKYSRWYAQGAEFISSYNGGRETLDRMMANNPQKWIDFLSKLPYRETIEDSATGLKILLSHSGYDARFNNPDMWTCIWNREHFATPVPDPNALMVHGHTPIPSMVKSGSWTPKDGALWYGETTQKICIDMGAVWTGATVLLDVDTLDEHVFQIEKESE